MGARVWVRGQGAASGIAHPPNVPQQPPPAQQAQQQQHVASSQPGHSAAGATAAGAAQSGGGKPPPNLQASGMRSRRPPAAGRGSQDNQAGSQEHPPPPHRKRAWDGTAMPRSEQDHIYNHHAQRSGDPSVHASNSSQPRQQPATKQAGALTCYVRWRTAACIIVVMTSTQPQSWAVWFEAIYMLSMGLFSCCCDTCTEQPAPLDVQAELQRKLTAMEALKQKLAAKEAEVARLKVRVGDWRRLN